MAKEEKAEILPEKKKKIILIAAGSGAGVLILIVILVLVFSGKSDHPAEGVNGTTETSGVEHKNNHGGDVEADKKKESGETRKDEKKADSENKKNEHVQQGNEKEEDKSKKGGGSKHENEASTASPSFGDAFRIPKLDLNLGNPIENRFIRIAIALEYRGKDTQLLELKQREAQLRDIIITSVTTKTRANLLSENGKEHLRREILNKINEVTDQPIQNVYFTEFFVE